MSVATEEETLTFCHELMSLWTKEGFCLTKWLSNSHVVLEATPEPHRAKTGKKLDFDQEFMPIERVLGV